MKIIIDIDNIIVKYKRAIRNNAVEITTAVEKTVIISTVDMPEYLKDSFFISNSIIYAFNILVDGTTKTYHFTSLTLPFNDTWKYHFTNNELFHLRHSLFTGLKKFAKSNNVYIEIATNDKTIIVDEGRTWHVIPVI